MKTKYMLSALILFGLFAILGISAKAYTPHEPIHINGNSQFTSANGVVSGSGTASDPYIIEEWDINASSADGIWIENTTAYFIIRNCKIHDGKSNSNYGIYFYNVTNGKIENCSIYNNWYGIYLDDSSNNNITSNYVYNNYCDGINLGWYSSNNNILSNCYVYNNSVGICLVDSSNNIITSNYVYNNSYYGIWLFSSSNNNITSNYVYNNPMYGIYLEYSSNSILRNNVLENNKYNFGVYGNDISHYYQDIDTSNTVNGKPIYYIIGQSNIVINETTNAGYIGLISCNNIKLENLTLTDNFQGILLINTSYTIISNCYVYNNSYGIYLYYSSNTEIHYNNIYNNTEYGIYSSPYTANATYNWWGHESGPYHPTLNPSGLGDNVSDNVDFIPWLTSPINLFSFILYKGWNLITLPCENNYNASSLFNAIDGCSIILSWNASLQDFILYAPGVPYDFAIEDGHGYFIGMSHNSIFSLNDIPVYNVSIPLYVGWNMLGWFKENETNADSIYNTITGCQIVLTWNASLQDFELYIPGSPYDFVIKRGDGFLVAVDEQSIWHGEG